MPYQLKGKERKFMAAFLREMIKNELQRHHSSRFDQEDIQALVERILGEEELWKLMHSLIGSYMVTHLESERISNKL